MDEILFTLTESPIEDMLEADSEEYEAAEIQLLDGVDDDIEDILYNVIDRMV